MLYVDGEPVAALAEVTRSDSPVVESLRAALDRQAAPLLAGAGEPREVTVMAEKSLPYAVLRKVVASCAAADYTKVSLAVVEREQALLAQVGA
jgi:biopolymer transport protein ExbD